MQTPVHFFQLSFTLPLLIASLLFGCAALSTSISPEAASGPQLAKAGRRVVAYYPSWSAGGR